MARIGKDFGMKKSYTKIKTQLKAMEKVTFTIKLLADILIHIDINMIFTIRQTDAIQNTQNLYKSNVFNLYVFTLLISLQCMPFLNAKFNSL